MRTRYLAAIAATALLGTASVALAQGDSTPEGAPQPAPSLTQAQALFGVLSGETGTPPDAILRALPEGGDLGLDPSQAVAIPAPRGERAAEAWYVVPGANGVCLATPDASTCRNLEAIKATGSLWYATPGKDAEPMPADAPPTQRGWIVRGLTVNQTSTVTASGIGRGETGSTKAADNAFYLYLPHGGDRLTLTNDVGDVVATESVVDPKR